MEFADFFAVYLGLARSIFCSMLINQLTFPLHLEMANIIIEDSIDEIAV